MRSTRPLDLASVINFCIVFGQEENLPFCLWQMRPCLFASRKANSGVRPTLKYYGERLVQIPVCSTLCRALFVCARGQVRSTRPLDLASVINFCIVFGQEENLPFCLWQMRPCLFASRKANSGVRPTLKYYGERLVQISVSSTLCRALFLLDFLL